MHGRWQAGRKRFDHGPCVRNLARFAEWDLSQAVAAASRNPARAARIANKGVLTVGADADFVVLSAAGEVLRSFIGGVECPRKFQNCPPVETRLAASETGQAPSLQRELWHRAILSNETRLRRTMAEARKFPHHLIREIFEQPDALRRTIEPRVSLAEGRVDLDEIHISRDELRGLRRINIVASGTSRHAGMTGQYMIQELAGVPVDVDYASEFEYRNPMIGRGEPASLLLSREKPPTRPQRSARRGRRGRAPSRFRMSKDRRCAGSRRIHLHPRWPGDQHCLDQGIHRADGVFVPVRVYLEKSRRRFRRRWPSATSGTSRAAAKDGNDPGGLL